MASLECSNCRYGIHYHGLPEGIEYIFFKWDDWKKIESKKFTSDEIESENLSGYSEKGEEGQDDAGEDHGNSRSVLNPIFYCHYTLYFRVMVIVIFSFVFFAGIK